MKKNLLLIFTMILFTAVAVSFPKQTHALAVKNQTDYDTQRMSVSSWGLGGSGSNFTFGPGKWEKWGRSDSSGVLLVDDKHDKTYFLDSELSTYIQSDTYLRSYRGELINPIDTDVPYGNGSKNKISVKNNSSSTIKVRINRWGSSGGNCSWYNIKNGKTEKWSRDDSRGYILGLQSSKFSKTRYYYVKPKTDLTFTDGGSLKVDGEYVSSIWMDY